MKKCQNVAENNKKWLILLKVRRRVQPRIDNHIYNIFTHRSMPALGSSTSHYVSLHPYSNPGRSEKVGCKDWFFLWIQNKAAKIKRHQQWIEKNNNYACMVMGVLVFVCLFVCFLNQGRSLVFNIVLTWCSGWIICTT